MKKISLVERIENHFRRNPETWYCGGEVQKTAAQVGYEPQNAGRRLRELVNDGILQVEYRKGNNNQEVAWYRYLPQQKEVTKIVVRDGKAYQFKQMELV